LNLKIIGLSDKDLQSIIDSPNLHDILTTSYAKDEYARREFNRKYQIDTQKKRTKLNKKYPEHKHIMKKWKEHKKRNRVK
jgi:hypothetical protein